MTSVSEVDWKIAPWRTSSSRSSLALTRLPLWPIPNGPCEQSTSIGWAFSMRLDPAVE